MANVHIRQQQQNSNVSNSRNGQSSEVATKRRRVKNERLKNAFEDIIRKYSDDFTQVGDEIDLLTGEIIVNNGHIERMRDEQDIGVRRTSRLLRDFVQDVRLTPSRRNQSNVVDQNETDEWEDVDDDDSAQDRPGQIRRPGYAPPSRQGPGEIADELADELGLEEEEEEEEEGEYDDDSAKASRLLIKDELDLTEQKKKKKSTRELAPFDEEFVDEEEEEEEDEGPEGFGYDRSYFYGRHFNRRAEPWRQQRVQRSRQGRYPMFHGEDFDVDHDAIQSFSENIARQITNFVYDLAGSLSRRPVLSDRDYGRRDLRRYPEDSRESDVRPIKRRRLDSHLPPTSRAPAALPPERRPDRLQPSRLQALREPETPVAESKHAHRGATPGMPSLWSSDEADLVRHNRRAAAVRGGNPAAIKSQPHGVSRLQHEINNRESAASKARIDGRQSPKTLLQVLEESENAEQVNLLTAVDDMSPFNTDSGGYEDEPLVATHLDRPEPTSRAPFTAEEDERLLRLHEKEQMLWVHIIKQFPGRTLRQLRYRYRKKLRPTDSDGNPLVGLEPSSNTNAKSPEPLATSAATSATAATAATAAATPAAAAVDQIAQARTVIQNTDDDDDGDDEDESVLISKTSRKRNPDATSHEAQPLQEPEERPDLLAVIDPILLRPEYNSKSNDTPTTQQPRSTKSSPAPALETARQRQEVPSRPTSVPISTKTSSNPAIEKTAASPSVTSLLGAANGRVGGINPSLLANLSVSETVRRVWRIQEKLHEDYSPNRPSANFRSATKEPQLSGPGSMPSSVVWKTTDEAHRKELDNEDSQASGKEQPKKRTSGTKRSRPKELSTQSDSVREDEPEEGLWQMANFDARTDGPLYSVDASLLPAENIMSSWTAKKKT